MNWTEEQILSLAPDESSKKSGRELASPSKWVSRHANEKALWGECKGSGANPYKTQIDLGNIAFKCSCPSRKFPCKHGLGLFLLYAREPKDFSQSETPAWVSEWLEKRSEKQDNKTEAESTSIPDANAKAKRVASRQKKVENGMEELQRWVKDIIRNGLVNMPEKGFAFWENMTKRMVDAQAPGLASMVRSLGNTSFFSDEWHTKFLDQLSRIHLVIESYKRIDSLPENLQSDIRSLIGFSQNQDELKTQPGIADAWVVLGKQVSQDDNLTVERNWFYGIQSKRYALILQFYVKSQLPTMNFAAGSSINAELVFFPSAFPLRAILRQLDHTQEGKSCEGFKSWNDVMDFESAVSAASPFIDQLPVIVEEILPVKTNNTWWMKDKEGFGVQLKSNEQKIMKLLSLSGGRPLDLFLVGRENSFEPVGVWYNSNYKSL